MLGIRQIPDDDNPTSRDLANCVAEADLGIPSELTTIHSLSVDSLCMCAERPDAILES
jgi:hypothetical protein